MHQSCGSGVWERTENAEPRHAGQSHMLLLNMHAQKGVLHLDLYTHIFFLPHSLAVSGRHLLFESSIWLLYSTSNKENIHMRTKQYLFFQSWVWPPSRLDAKLTQGVLPARKDKVRKWRCNFEWTYSIYSMSWPRILFQISNSFKDSFFFNKNSGEICKTTLSSWCVGSMCWV